MLKKVKTVVIAIGLLGFVLIMRFPVVHAAMLSSHTYIYNAYDVIHTINRYSYYATAKGKLILRDNIYPQKTCTQRVEGVLVSNTYGPLGTYDSGTVTGPITGFEVNAASATTSYSVSRVSGNHYIDGILADTMTVY